MTRNQGFGEYCGRPNPNSARAGACCVLRGNKHKSHRDLVGNEWTDLAEEPKRETNRTGGEMDSCTEDHTGRRCPDCGGCPDCCRCGD